MSLGNTRKIGTMGRLCLWSSLLLLGCVDQPIASDTPKEAVALDHDALMKDGRAVIERSIAAVGGREALARIKNRVMKGTIQVKPLGVEGTFEIIQARPNKVYMKILTQGLGLVERGCDGRVFWERRSQQTLRFLGGEELQLHLLTAFFDETYHEQMYKSVETMGLETIEETPCYKVLLVPHQGPSVINYYARDSGLHVKTLLQVNRGGFHVPMETFSHDYREIDPIKIAHAIVEKSMGTETWRKLTDIAFNIQVPEGIFDPPPEPDNPNIEEVISNALL